MAKIVITETESVIVQTITVDGKINKLYFINGRDGLTSALDRRFVEPTDDRFDVEIHNAGGDDSSCGVTDFEGMEEAIAEFKNDPNWTSLSVLKRVK